MSGAAARAAAARIAQGLPPRLEDPDAIARIVRILARSSAVRPPKGREAA